MCAWWTGQPIYGSNPTSKFIRENFAYLKTRADLVDLITANPGEINAACDGATAKNAHTHADTLGFLQRTRFTRTGPLQFTLGAAAYHINGAEEKIVHWDSVLTINLVTIAANTWYYVYIDDSTIALGIDLLVAGNITVNATAPTWNATKHGYYNGNDRCIFMFLPAVLDTIPTYYWHDGSEYVGTNTGALSYNTHPMIAAHVTNLPRTPPICTRAELMVYYGVNASHQLFVGPSAANYKHVYYESGSSGSFSGMVGITPGIPPTVYLASDVYIPAGAFHLCENGFYLPEGM